MANVAQLQATITSLVSHPTSQSHTTQLNICPLLAPLHGTLVADQWLIPFQLDGGGHLNTLMIQGGGPVKRLALHRCRS